MQAQPITIHSFAATNITIWLTILISTMLSGCQDKTPTPLEVSQEFWQVIQNRDVDEINSLSAAGTLTEDLDKDDIISVSAVSFGKILINGQHAEVETEVTIDKTPPLALPVETVLLNQNEMWKVDYRATMDAINNPDSLSQFLQGLRTFSENFSDALDDSMQEFDRTMPEIENEIREMGEQLGNQLPELKQRFDQLAEEVRKAIEQSLQEDQQERTDPDEEVDDQQSYSI